MWGIPFKLQYSTTARCSNASLISATFSMAQWCGMRHASVPGHEKVPPERGLGSYPFL